MNNVPVIDLNPSRSDFLNDVVEGLKQNPKRLHPKYLYDEKGSQIFDKICDLQEYYPTRTEISILNENSKNIEDLLEDKTALIEFGSGSSIKIRHLLEDTNKIKAYLPIDISKEHLIQAAEQIQINYPKLPVVAICADYTQLESFPEIEEAKSLEKAVFFPGSTIGNLNKDEAIELLRNTHQWIGEGGLMILGIDLIKETSTLIKAYDDSKNVTADFNLNILTRINRELGGNFDIDSFEHEARFNPEKKRVEMHLVSQKDQKVTIDKFNFTFEKGESIHTESSHKFELNQFAEIAKAANFTMQDYFSDASRKFAVCILKAA